MKRKGVPGTLALMIVFGAGLLLSCGNPVTEKYADDAGDSSEAVVTFDIGGAVVSPLRGADGSVTWKSADNYFYARKASALLEPPIDVSVADVPDDNGHFLELTWAPSPSEKSGLVSWYYLFRSRSAHVTEPKALTKFTDIESLNDWEAERTVLVDSVKAGTTAYTDFVPINGTPYHYWLQSVGFYDQTGQEMYTVTGTVTDSSGMPLGGVLLRLYDNPGWYDRYTVSLSDGSYVFEHVPPGSYFLIAKRDNYTIFNTAVAVP